MKKTFSFVLMMWVGQTFAQPIYFNRSYDLDTMPEWGNSVAVLPNGDYLSAGDWMDFNNLGKREIELIKFNIYGDTIWKRIITNDSTELEPIVLKKINDNQYAIAGTATLSNSCFRFFLAMVDSSGGNLWMKIYTPQQYLSDVLKDLVMTSDGGYLLVGDVANFCGPSGIIKLHVLKTDSNGNEEWQGFYGGDSLTFTFGWAGIETSDHGFLLAANSSINDAGFFADGYLAKIDSLGSLQWQQVYGDLGVNDGFESILYVGGNQYLIFGYKTMGIINSYAENWNGWVVDVDENGDEQWERTFGTDSSQFAFYKKAIVTSDGNIAILGQYVDFPYNFGKHTEGWLMKITLNGDSLWSHFYRGDTGFYYMNQFLIFDDYFYDFTETIDSGFIITGSSHPYTQDVWLLKLDKYGCEQPGCENETGVTEVTANENQFLVFPNPANEELTIQFTSASALIVYDLLGREIERRMLSPAENSVTLYVRDWAQGMYMIQLQQSNEQQTKKVLVVH